MLLVLFGGLALVDQLAPNLAVNGHLLWPAFILGTGVLVIVAGVRRRPADQPEA